MAGAVSSIMMPLVTRMSLKPWNSRPGLPCSAAWASHSMWSAIGNTARPSMTCDRSTGWVGKSIVRSKTAVISGGGADALGSGTATRGIDAVAPLGADRLFEGRNLPKATTSAARPDRFNS